MWNYVLPRLTWAIPFASTLEKSGAAYARLITDPKLENISGKYFHEMKEIPSSTDSYDLTKARDLWETSIKLSGLKASETILKL
jgi:hypothetical protein